MEGQIQLVGLDWGDMCAVDIHDLILDEMPEEPVHPKKPRTEQTAEWEVVFGSGADIAIRRRKGKDSRILALIVGKDQYYVWDERKGEKVPATGARLTSFFKGCEEPLVPWFAGDLGEVSGKNASTLLSLLANEGFNSLLRRGLITLDKHALGYMGGRHGRYDRGLSFMSGVDSRQQTFKAVMSALLKHYPKDDIASVMSSMVGAWVAEPECGYKVRSLFGYLDNISGILETLGLDSTRKIIDAVLDDEGENATSLYVLSRVLDNLRYYNIAFEPKVLARYATAHIDDMGEWKAYVDEALGDNRFIDHLYPRDPRSALNDYRRRRTEARNLGLQQRFTNRIAMLGSKEFDNGEFLIRLPRSSSELEDEGRSLHHCVGGFVDRHATMKTTIWFMRRSADPETPYVTIQVDGGSVSGEVIQAHGLSNRDVNDAEAAFIKEWAKRSGYKYDRRRCNRMVG